MNKGVQIQLPTPCSQDWDDMKSIPEGKFCSSCEKKVIDFSLLNDRQILEIVRNNKHICGRFANEQLNRELHVTATQSNAFIPALIVSTALATGVSTTAYAAREIEKTVIVQDTTKPVEKIPDNTSECLPGYSALSQGLVVTALAPRRKESYTTGVIVVIPGDEIKKVPMRVKSFPDKKKKRRFFWF